MKASVNKCVFSFRLEMLKGDIITMENVQRRIRVSRVGRVSKVRVRVRVRVMVSYGV